MVAWFVQVPVLPQRLRLRPGQMPEIPPSIKYRAPREHEEFYAAMREECAKVNLLDKDTWCAPLDLWWCSLPNRTASCELEEWPLVVHKIV